MKVSKGDWLSAIANGIQEDCPNESAVDKKINLSDIIAPMDRTGYMVEELSEDRLVDLILLAGLQECLEREWKPADSILH